MIFNLRIYSLLFCLVFLLSSCESANSPSSFALMDNGVSKWTGSSSDGSSSEVTIKAENNQSGELAETWTDPKGTQVNIYGSYLWISATQAEWNYTRPAAAKVKVSVESKDNGQTRVATVTESNSSIFSVGEVITYSLKK